MVWLSLVTAHRPAPIQCPTSHAGQSWTRSRAPTFTAAAPPCISGRTSYLQVRLAFHLYPQVIPQFCNTGGFGPRRGLTPASPCPWVAHLVSGRILATLLLARFRLAFAVAPALYRTLTFHPRPPRDARCCQHTLAGSFYKRHAVRRLAGPKPTRTLPSDCLSVQGFRGSFIPLPGYFSPFPHGTGSLSVARSIRALEGGPPSFPQGFSCPVVLRYSHPSTPWSACPLRDSHPLRWAFPDPSRRPHLVAVSILRSPDAALSTPTPPPRGGDVGLGASPVRSPLLRASPQQTNLRRSIGVGSRDPTFDSASSVY